MEAFDGAKLIVAELQKCGFIAYFAGGWVRDYLMGHPSADIDIATDAPTSALLDLFPRTILVGLHFGVVIVVMGEQQYEVASFRRDISYSNGRKPDEIAPGSPEEDACRRDFTINGMFFDPLTEQIYDFVGGRADLKLGLIRTIGNPYERFVEDRLRMVRAVRFAARFGFFIDTETYQAIAANAYSLFPAVAIERIWQELNKMAATERFEGAVIELHRLGLLQEIFPQLRHTHLHDIRHRVSSFAHFPEKCPTILYLSQLFTEANLKSMVDVCRALKVPIFSDKLLEVYFEGIRLVERQQSGTDGDLTVWARYYAHPQSALCLQVIAAKMAPEQRESFLAHHAGQRLALNDHIERIAHKKPLLTASRLKKEGIPTGKFMGKLLKRAEQIAIVHNMQDSEMLLLRLKNDPLWQEGA